MSGNDYHLTAGSAPKYITTGLNSLPSVRFADASLDYFLSANDTVVLNSNVHSCFVVIKPETGLGSNSRMLGFLGNTASVDHDNTGSVIWVLQLSGSGAFTSFANSAERVTSSAFSTGTAYRVGIIYDGSNPTLYKNNTGTTAGGAYNQTLSSPGQILIGAHQNGAPGFGEELVGDVSEVIITNIAPDATLRNTIDAYLVAKWGF